MKGTKVKISTLNVRRRGIYLFATTAVLTALVAGVSSPAGAGAGLSDPIATGLAGPLQIAVGTDGTIYVGQAFAGLLSSIDNKGQHILAAVEGEVAGVAANGPGSVTFTSSIGGGPESPPTATNVSRLNRDGSTRVLGDLLTYEQTVNPDQHNSYGFQGLSAACAAMVPPEIGGGDPYPGLIDSHPYSVAIGERGRRFVADAAGNSILRVSESGEISTVAVLPAQPFIVNAGVAAGLGLPECTIGKAYNFEPVPTDVEVGADGMLYVTTLPGGPEDASLGARGSVYKVNPYSGAMARIATGFLGATNLALGRGTIYVSELFANRVSRVVNGGAQVVVSVNEPAGLEYANGKLYVSYNVFGDGSIATIG